MSVFFMIGRKVYRSHERTFVKIDCRITAGNHAFTCLTNDISEGGISVVLDNPRYVPSDSDVIIRLTTERYDSAFMGKVVHVEEVNRKWKYAFLITGIEEDQKRQLLQIIYDREPTLPQRLDESSGTFEDIRFNFLKRRKNEVAVSNRKLPRIMLDRVVSSIECGSVKLVDFNYEYIQIKFGADIQFAPPGLTLTLPEDIVLDCDYVQSLRNHAGSLYRISNYEAIAKSGSMDKLLKDWLQEALVQQRQKQQTKKKTVQQTDELDEMAFL